MSLFDNFFGTGKYNMPVIDRVLVGESLVIEDGDLDNVAHIDLIMGPRGSAAEDAFCRTLTDQKQGVNGLLAVVAPNLMVKPATVMFHNVTIKKNCCGSAVTRRLIYLVC